MFQVDIVVLERYSPPHQRGSGRIEDVVYLRRSQAVTDGKCKHGPEAPLAPVHGPMMAENV